MDYRCPPTGMCLAWVPRHSAGVAQLVEHDLAKVGVAGSSPVSRSMGKGKPLKDLRSLGGFPITNQGVTRPRYGWQLAPDSWVCDSLKASEVHVQLAPWPSGKAEDCKSFIPGSNPGGASFVKHYDTML